MKRRIAELARRVAELEEEAGVNTCSTCGHWPAVVVEMEDATHEPAPEGELSGHWGVWREHGGSCPDCDRRPGLLTVVTHLHEPPAR